MNSMPSEARHRRALATATVMFGLVSVTSAQGQSFQVPVELHTGTRVHLELDAGPSLKLESFDVPFGFLNVATLHGAADGSGTIVRIDTDTGEVLGEYRTAPNGYATNPSRTSIDSFGNVWVGNRDIERIDEVASVVKIGVVIGGTACDASGHPDPSGEYLRPPFLYSTVVDRDGDGLIRTSRGLGDVLDWQALTDGQGGFNGGDARVEEALDECILVYQRIATPLVRHVTVDAHDDVWVGDSPTNAAWFQKLDGNTGAVLATLPNFACVGFGGLIDSHGTLWSANDENDALLRFEPNDANSAQCISIPNLHGLGLDHEGNLWASQHSARSITKIRPDGTLIFQNKSVPGAGVLRGIANTADGHVWIADSQQNLVFRLQADGTSAGPPIAVGSRPTAVSVDGHGDVWVACKDSTDVRRIDPTAGANGAVDLIVPLGANSEPQGYRDMTSTVVTDWAVERGYWVVTHDSGQTGTQWTRADWTATLPPGSSIRIFARCAEVESELANAPSLPIVSGVPFSTNGRFIQLDARFISSQASHQSPVLHDMKLSGVLAGTPCATPNRRTASSLLLYPLFGNSPDKLTVLTLTNTGAENIDVEYVYINGDDCHEFNRTEKLTGHDTFSLITAQHNPAPQQEGYVYVFAKQAGKAVTYNKLIGQELVLSGLSSFDYAINAVGFEGIGEGGLTDLDGDGTRDLDGLEYAMAPDSLLIPRFFGQHEYDDGVNFQARLILIALAGGATFQTTVDLLIYNDNEQVFSAEHNFRCWEAPTLIELTSAFKQQFLSANTDQDLDEMLGAPHVETGWFRVDGSSASSSATTLANPAIYAVLVDFVGTSTGADLPFELCEQSGGGLMHHGLHGD